MLIQPGTDTHHTHSESKSLNHETATTTVETEAHLNQMPVSQPSAVGPQFLCRPRAVLTVHTGLVQDALDHCLF